MWVAMRSVEMDFLDSAPKRWVIERDVAAPLADVWRTYTDPTTWSQWFPGVAWARYHGDPPPRELDDPPYSVKRWRRTTRRESLRTLGVCKDW